MENLVLCPCGHSLAKHDWDGCKGDRSENCDCTLDRHYALEAAIDQARSLPAYFGSFPESVARPVGRT
jgi:hypothetical protein